MVSDERKHFVNQTGLCEYEGFGHYDSNLNHRGSGHEHILQVN